ncbi:MAG TPA: amidohydrolase [Thermoanaerobaculia bacterium]|nr:amidohydrolase [Thermoanaerobaculia bacterium]
MKRLLAATLILLTTPSLLTAAAPRVMHLAEKRMAVAAIEKDRERLAALSDEIWRYAETALKETRSSKALADFAEQNGFRVTRGVAGMPTAFVAEYGSGRPVIGIMGEYDALPGLSQKAQASREAIQTGAPGHGCGHNLFGVGSLAAATAVKQLIEAAKLHGTVRFFGTPAEESVGGKVYMLRDGVMNGVDVMLAWHPDDKTLSDTKSTQAIVDLNVEFFGRAAHAAYDPWNGRSAVDGLEIFTHAVNMMREHVHPSSRMHYVIVKGGDVPNVVPEYGKVWIWLRDEDREIVDEMLARIRKMAAGAAMAADVESKVTINAGDWNMLVNMTGQRVAQDNLEWLGPLQFSPEEQEFAKTIQRANKIPEKGLVTAVQPFEDKPGPAEGGSTDVADISWNMPIIHISVTTAPAGAPWHGWSVVACGGMSIGHKGMIYASEALAATMIDLFTDPKKVEEIRQEFAKKTAGKKYTSYIPDGPPRLAISD